MGEFTYALRRLRKSGGFTAVAILSLGLGIGANTTVFSLLNDIAWRTLAAPQPDRLAGISTLDAAGRQSGLTYGRFEQIAAHQRSFSALFAWQDLQVFTFEAEGALFPGAALLASDGFTETMRIRPVLGRGIAPGDGAVAVLGFACWRAHFHGSPKALGKTVRIQGKPFTIVGIAPEALTDMEGSGAVDAVVPLGSFTSLDRLRESRAPGWQVTGRLRPGVAMEQCQAEMQALWVQIGSDSKSRITVESAARGTGFNYPRQRFTRPLEFLMGMVALLLLLSSANLAMLLLSRADAQRWETAVKIALGAGNRRILRQHAVESALLAMSGAALGAIIARSSTHWLSRFIFTGNIDRGHNLSFDGSVFAFTTAIAIASALLFGMAPAWCALGTDPQLALARRVRGIAGTAGRTATVLVTIQVALSLVLVTAAALFTASEHYLGSTPLGFHLHGMQGMMLTNRPGGYTGMQPEIYYPQLFQRLSRVPGVESVSASNLAPILPPFLPDVKVRAGDAIAAVQEFLVAPEFFRTLEIPILSGREFSFHDTKSSTPMAIISQALALRLFGVSNATGRQIVLQGNPDARFEIAGVAHDSAVGSLQKPNPLQLYLSLFQQDAARQPYVLVRTNATAMPEISRSLRSEVESMGREYPLRMDTMDETVSRALVQERMMATLVDALGALSLLLAGIGLYGLVSYSVVRRTGEIGVRMAFGASPRAVVRMLYSELLIPVLAGFFLSVPAVYAGGKLAESMLHGIAPFNGFAMAGSAGVLFAVAIIAVSVPARRAAKLEPMRAMERE